MRSIDEQKNEIMRRSAVIQRRRVRKQTALIASVSSAMSMVLIILTAFTMPDFQAGMLAMPSLYGASFANNAAVGYVVIGVLAFVLGVCTALLCIYLPRKGGRRR